MIEKGKAFNIKLDGLTIPAICIDVASQTLMTDEDDNEYYLETFLCYAQNRLFYYNKERGVEVLCEYCVIPDLDRVLEIMTSLTSV